MPLECPLADIAWASRGYRNSCRNGSGRRGISAAKFTFCISRDDRTWKVSPSSTRFYYRYRLWIFLNATLLTVNLKADCCSPESVALLIPESYEFSPWNRFTQLLHFVGEQSLQSMRIEYRDLNGHPPIEFSQVNISNRSVSEFIWFKFLAL